LSDLNKTPKGTADLLIALLDELKVQKAVVVGISAGGLTALEIAANYPHRVESLVLMSALTKKWFVETDKAYVGGKKLFAPKVQQVTWLLYRLFFKLFPKMVTRAMFRALSTYRPIEFAEDEYQELRQMTLQMRSDQGFYNDLDQNIDQQILSRIQCPTLILHSNYDNAVAISHALSAKSKIKNSRLVTFNNHWGHLIWLGKDYDQYLSAFKEQVNLKK
jgi:pimeloyl-ACP methyl ester carboxylesterase